MITDLKLTRKKDGIFDLSIKDGNFEKEQGFDTLLNVLLLTDARADSSQVIKPEDRRGWLGNTVNKVQGRQLGSLLWTLNQSRLNQDSVNKASNFSEKALSSIVEDGLAAKIEITGDIIPLKGIQITIKITSIDGNTQSRFIEIWKNTG